MLMRNADVDIEAVFQSKDLIRLILDCDWGSAGKKINRSLKGEVIEIG